MPYKFKYGNTEIQVPKAEESLYYQYGLGANVNLNNLTKEGYYHQAANVNTSLSLNYPTAEAGLLTVINRGYIYQTYQTYNNSGFWYRSYYNGTWYAWKKVPNINGDTFNGVVNGYYFTASNNQGLRVNDTSGNPREIIFMNPNNMTCLPNNHVDIYQNLYCHYIENRGSAAWIGSLYTAGSEWLGFYNAYGGTRKGWIGHDGATAFKVTNEAGGYIGINNNGNGIGFSMNGAVFYMEGYSNYSLRPQGDDSGKHTLGASYAKWKQVWATTGSIQTSDRNKKKDFKTFDERYEKLFFDLKPQLYKYKDGTSDRFHSGFIAQDVENSLDKYGLTSLELAAFCKDKAKVVIKTDNNGETLEDRIDEEGNPIYDYSLRYEEFISLNTHMIQKLYQKVNQQQEEITSLKNEIQELKKLITK